MDITNMFQRTDKHHYLEQVHSHMNYPSFHVNSIIHMQNLYSQSRHIASQSYHQKSIQIYFQMKEKLTLPTKSQAIILINQNYESLIKSQPIPNHPFHLKQILLHFYAHQLDLSPQLTYSTQSNDDFSHQIYNQQPTHYNNPLSILIRSQKISLLRLNQSQIASQFKHQHLFPSNLSHKIHVLQPKLWIEINKKINSISVHSGDIQSIQNTHSIKLNQPLDSSLYQHHYDWKHCQKPYQNTMNEQSQGKQIQNPMFNLTHFRIFIQLQNLVEKTSMSTNIFDPFKTYLSLKVLGVETKKRPQLKQYPNILEYKVSEFEEMPSEIRQLYFRLKNVDLLKLCPQKELEFPETTEELIQSSIHQSLVTDYKLIDCNQAPIGILNHLLKMKTDQAYKEFTTTKICQKSPKQIYEWIKNQRVGYIRLKLSCPKGSYPGSPAVMEIWPPYYCSPIHNHGQAFALVKVLAGQVRVQNFEDLTLQDQKRPYLKSSYTKGQYTWLSENSFGIHRVLNLHPQTSITVQGYYDHKQGWDEGFSFVHENRETKEKQFAMYYPQHDWENYLNKRSISNQADNEFIDRVVQYYDLEDKETGQINCSYGKLVNTLVKEYNVLREIIDHNKFLFQ